MCVMTWTEAGARTMRGVTRVDDDDVDDVEDVDDDDDVDDVDDAGTVERARRGVRRMERDLMAGHDWTQHTRQGSSPPTPAGEQRSESHALNRA